MFITYSYADADTPKAADLVEDGQKIDVNQPKHQELFEELRREHGFSKNELDIISPVPLFTKRHWC